MARSGPSAPEASPHIPPSGSAIPILHQIQAALATLIQTGEETVLDMGSLPVDDDDWAWITATLGAGEVTAVVATVGESRVRETGVSGVWIVEHDGAAGGPPSRFIEISEIPMVLKSQRADMEAGLQTLFGRLSGEFGP